MLNIVCALLGHHRSKRHRKPAAGIWMSQCSICRTRMERIGPGQWLPVAKLPNLGRRPAHKAATTAD
jgi:hypothetical protein